MFAADAVVVDAGGGAAASRSDGRPTEEGVLPEFRGENSIISSLRNVLFVRPRRMLFLVLNSCPVLVHLRLLRSCVWLYIVVGLLLLVVPSVISPPSVLRRYWRTRYKTHARELV
jgi:hypothetical protein